MQKFIITSRATATIEETWTIMAENEDDAREHFERHASDSEGIELTFGSDHTVGDEEDRYIESVEPYEAPTPSVVMAEPLPLATMMLYRRLADGLYDMVENDRLTADAVPDDYSWLVEQLKATAEADPGDAVLPPHMQHSGEEDAQSYLNTYDCPCGEHWTDTWSACCDDDCPKCGTTCSPTSSEEQEED